MNLHDLARPLITVVHGDEKCYVYHSVGQQNIKGVIKSVYEMEEVMANVQSVLADRLQQVEKISDTGSNLDFYLYSKQELPVSGIVRTLARTGDFIQRANGDWYLVTIIKEDWSSDGWCKVQGTLQLTPPEIEV